MGKIAKWELVKREDLEALVRYAELGKNMLHPAIYYDQSKFRITRIIKKLKKQLAQEN